MGLDPFTRQIAEKVEEIEETLDSIEETLDELLDIVRVQGLVREVTPDDLDGFELGTYND